MPMAAAATVALLILLNHQTLDIAGYYYVDGFRVMVTELGALTAPLLSVTVRLNVRGVEAETVGAGNVGAAVLAPVSVTVGLPDVWTHD